MKCPKCGAEVRVRMCLHVEELPGVDVEEGVTPVVGKAVACEKSLLPKEEFGEKEIAGLLAPALVPRKAMTSAERAKAYRERKKKEVGKWRKKSE